MFSTLFTSLTRVKLCWSDACDLRSPYWQPTQCMCLSTCSLSKIWSIWFPKHTHMGRGPMVPQTHIHKHTRLIIRGCFPLLMWNPTRNLSLWDVANSLCGMTTWWYVWKERLTRLLALDCITRECTFYCHSASGLTNHSASVLLENPHSFDR